MLCMGNLPNAGEMNLDHTGHFVPDANAASTALTAMGFTVTPYSAQVQPDSSTGEPQLTGTGNICVMLKEGYLEFLVHTADTPIGKEFLEALNRRAGLHLSAFAVTDAASHHAQLEAAGHTMRPLVNFSREVETETGTATARFCVARLAAGVMTEGRVQVVTHFDENAMWQSRWTSHANRAHSLRAIVISSPDPNETAARFSNFLGIEPQSLGEGGLSLKLNRGSVDIYPETSMNTMIGHTVEPGRSVFAALRIGVPDLPAMKPLIESSTGVAVELKDERLVAPFHPALGIGSWIFEQL